MQQYACKCSKNSCKCKATLKCSNTPVNAAKRHENVAKTPGNVAKRYENAARTPGNAKQR